MIVMIMRVQVPPRAPFVAPEYTPLSTGAASASLHQLGLQEGYIFSLFVENKVLKNCVFT